MVVLIAGSVLLISGIVISALWTPFFVGTITDENSLLRGIFIRPCYMRFKLLLIHLLFSVNHDYSALFKGQASIVVVNGPGGQPGKILGLKDTLNPSNAIPPMGKNSIPVPTKPYQLGTPLKLTTNQIGPLKVCKEEIWLAQACP